MPYTRTTWQDLPSTATPVNAARLNNMEQGLVDLFAVVESGRLSQSGLDGRYFSRGLISSGNWNTFLTAGSWEVADGLSNAPATGNVWYLDVRVNGADPSFVRQMATSFWNAATYVRTKTGSTTWTAWLKITP